MTSLNMLKIPSTSIISSKLSPLEPADIPRIVQFAQSRCNNSCLERHLQTYPETALMAVGISNQHDLQRVMTAQVPVIHIEHDCEALQGAHRRQHRDAKYMRFLHRTLSTGLWGLFFTFGAGVRNSTRLYPALLTAYTLYVFRATRNDYSILQDEKHFVLIRDDARHTPMQFIMRTVIPYCVQCASMFFLFKGILWCWKQQHPLLPTTVMVGRIN
ncbi:hypothetical protein K492DRAFT_67466 [Lichtheimia hyalospora FSU 10163]|nr:hypothetical protein K492DRAFT_67466 [Lichtheimia hyalospora FSU 10163]